MSLIAFHRFLIGAAILFCFGFAGWELLTWWVTRSGGALLVGVTFVAFGILLTYYLARLRRFLGLGEGEEERGPGGPGR